MSYECNEHSIGARCYSNVPCDLSVRILCPGFDGFLLEKHSDRLPKNRYRSNNVCSYWECSATVGGKLLHSGHRSRRPQFVWSADRWLSTTSVCSSSWAQMTTSHPVPEHHLPVLARAFLLWLGFFGLFFQPTRQRIWTDAIKTLNTSHTRPFIIGSNDFFFLGFRITTFGFQYCPVIAVFAPILLAAAAIMPIFDNICTTTAPTSMIDRFCYHPASLPFITWFDALPFFVMVNRK